MEGSPVSSLVAFALESSWAKTALRWGVYLRRAFPKQAGEPRERVGVSTFPMFYGQLEIQSEFPNQRSIAFYMLTTVDMPSVPSKRCSSMVMW